MKCTNCGKNKANCHYKYNINGKITEAHLCDECAAKLEEDSALSMAESEFNSLFGDFNRVFDDMFSTPFFGRRSRSLLSDLLMPEFTMPRLVFAIPGVGSEESAEAPAKQQESVNVDPKLSKRREMNMLREQMKAAAEAEDYEKAAELRDKLRNMENNKT